MRQSRLQVDIVIVILRWYGCEISLRPFTFCNLTEINAGTVKSQEDFNKRASIAAFYGTLQAGFSDFHYLRNIWRINTEKDALIGVGVTGIGNGKLTDIDLKESSNICKKVNEYVAELININKAARTTTIKPSGTSSLVCGVSSGIHSWHSKYYIRNMQCKIGDDLYNYFKENHPGLIKDMELMPDSAVVGIPQKAPDDAILRENETALTMLDRVRLFNTNWVKQGHNRGPNTNNVSATVSVKQSEWSEVFKWMWNNKHTFNGLSVLPYDGGTYKDAPFMEITKEEFDKKLEYLNKQSIDLTLIKEEFDNTDLAGEIACGPGGCEVI